MLCNIMNSNILLLSGDGQHSFSSCGKARRVSPRLYFCMLTIHSCMMVSCNASHLPYRTLDYVTSLPISFSDNEYTDPYLTVKFKTHCVIHATSITSYYLAEIPPHTRGRFQQKTYQKQPKHLHLHQFIPNFTVVLTDSNA